MTTALSVVMLLVLSSLAGSKVAGIREWGQANALAIIALLLFASRGVLPDLLSIEVANALYLGTIALMYAGFRRHLGLPVPRGLLLGGALAALAGVVVFHHLAESLAMRVVSVSCYHAAVYFAIFATLRGRVDGRLRYPFAFTRSAALVLGIGHAVRGAFHAVEAYAPVSLLEPSTANLVFLAIGTLALPALTLGAVMMANARVISETAYAADHDHLTGAPSRRAFFAIAERELARAQRHAGGLGLLLVDADHFKRINDTYGHGVGDQVLRDLAERTREAIRKIDHFARLGGEEFAVLLPDAGLEAARAVAERLRAALDRSAAATPSGHGVTYTVSIGLAMLEEGDTFASLMARADAALYAAKAGGRNMVVCAEGTGLGYT
ncbi:diguanylate cyclase [Massilia consociata]|uniref:diguanylate cyclase n=1 Tax=Massilia consociata TaxID=760117 RepID=A0ABV6FH50_9BURK